MQYSSHKSINQVRLWPIIMTIPKLIIPEGIWNQLVEEAKTSDETLKAFGLFSENRTASRRNYVVRDFMRINVEVVRALSLN